jgi:egghead protein (zeste-white 4 protein)
VTLPTVIFQITAIGKNVRALDATVESVRYWVRRTPYLRFRYLIWVVAEPEGYATDPALYAKWRSEGVGVYIVPKEYETPQRTRGKGRALEYACDLRRANGLSTKDVWVYHQDEETCVGQDTLLGVSEFVQDGSKLLGTGIILYPIHWAPIPTHVQEFTRSYDDLRVLDSLTLPGNPTVGFHGSHFVVRADAEDEVGWDLPGYAPAEDLTFEIRLRSRFGSVFGILRGFAYEKGAFSLGDQLRQRRRWVRGILYAIGSVPSLSRRRRMTLLYSAAAWFSALPSVLVLIASFALHYGSMLYLTSFFTGFVWVSMITGYVEGARIHSAYLESSPGIVRLSVLGLVGALVDVVAPWFALVTRTTSKDFVLKDPVARPRPTPSPSTLRAGAGAPWGPTAFSASSVRGIERRRPFPM